MTSVVRHHLDDNVLVLTANALEFSEDQRHAWTLGGGGGKGRRYMAGFKSFLTPITTADVTLWHTCFHPFTRVKCDKTFFFSLRCFH